MKVDERPDGVSIIAIYYVFFAVMNLLGSCAILIFVILPTITYRGDEGFGLISSIFGVGIAFLIAVAGILLGLVAGLGLLRLKDWARLLAIVLAIFTLLGFPIGTVIGALIIWYLVKPEVKEVFH